MNEITGIISQAVETDKKIPCVNLGIETRTSLAKNENFYSQEPFMSVVAGASRQYGIPEDKVRTELSFIAKGRHWRQMPEKTHPDYERWKSEDAMLARARPHVAFLRDALKRYPYWYEYIQANLNRSYYSNDGNFRLIQYAKPSYTKTFEETITYTKWITQKLEAERKEEKPGEDKSKTAMAQSPAKFKVVTVESDTAILSDSNPKITLPSDNPKYAFFSTIDLKPGQTIEEVTDLKDLDVLVQVLADKMTGLKNTTIRFWGSADGAYSRTLSDLLSKQAYDYKVAGRRFMGALRDFDTRIIPDDLSHQELAKESSGKLVKFTVEASLYSTGRGNIGEVGRLVTLEADEKAGKGKLVNMNSRTLPKSNSRLKRIINKLHEESQLSYEAAYREALSNIYPGGLPSLGKKR